MLTSYTASPSTEKTAINQTTTPYHTYSRNSSEITNNLLHSSGKSINSNIDASPSLGTRSNSSKTSIERNKCFCFSNYKRQQFCLNILYYNAYSLCYVVIIIITLGAFIYDLIDLHIDNLTLADQPTWFIALNMSCLALMVFDILIHIQAFQSIFFKSAINWMDFLFVVICTVITPIYWFVPAWILLSLLLLRFTVRLLRRHTFRKQYVSARNVIVDFGAYENNQNEQRKYTDYASGDI